MGGGADGRAVRRRMGVRRVGARRRRAPSPGCRRRVSLQQQAGAGAYPVRASVSRLRPSASPDPETRRAAPAAMASFISRPVSSAEPKRPSGSTASTSSLVSPAMPISKSWIAAAPFSTKPWHSRGASGREHRREAALDDVPAQAPQRSRAVARALPRAPPPRRGANRRPEAAAAIRASSADRRRPSGARPPKCSQPHLAAALVRWGRSSGPSKSSGSLAVFAHADSSQLCRFSALFQARAPCSCGFFTDYLLRSARGHHVARRYSPPSGPRSMIQSARLDHIQLMLDHHHRVAQVHQAGAARPAACARRRSAARWWARRA